MFELTMEDTVHRTAQFSACRTWRYTLERYWDERPHVLFILLNPSTADELHDDPTNRRGIRYAERWGYGGVVFCNLFAFRSPYPDKMKKARDPVGPENDQFIISEARRAALVIAAWGIHGRYMRRNEWALRHVADLHCLSETKDGHPAHILYLSSTLTPHPITEKSHQRTIGD